MENTIGIKLQQLIKEHEQTNAKAAEAIGVSASLVSDVINGKKKQGIGVDIAKKICEHYRVSSDWLLGIVATSTEIKQRTGGKEMISKKELIETIKAAERGFEENRKTSVAAYPAEARFEAIAEAVISFYRKTMENYGALAKDREGTVCDQEKRILDLQTQLEAMQCAANSYKSEAEKWEKRYCVMVKNYEEELEDLRKENTNLCVENLCIGPATVTRRSVLEEAIRCVCTDRNNQYGEPEDNFAAIAKLWAEYTGVSISAHNVAMMMALFKVGRIMTGGVKADSYVDACGYLACAAEIGLKEKH